MIFSSGCPFLSHEVSPSNTSTLHLPNSPLCCIVLCTSCAWQLSSAWSSSSRKPTKPNARPCTTPIWPTPLYQQLGPGRPLGLANRRGLSRTPRPCPALPSGSKPTALGTAYRHRRHLAMDSPRSPRRYPGSGRPAAPPRARPHTQSYGLDVARGRQERQSPPVPIPRHPLPTDAAHHATLCHRAIHTRGAQTLHAKIEI